MNTLGGAACIIACPMEASLTSTSFPANIIFRNVFRQSGMYVCKRSLAWCHFSLRWIHVLGLFDGFIILDKLCSYLDYLSFLLLRIFVFLWVKVMENPESCAVECNNIWFPIYFCYAYPFPKVFQQLALHVWETVWFTVFFNNDWMTCCKIHVCPSSLCSYLKLKNYIRHWRKIITNS